MESKQIGNFGERIAENYLKNKGYQILDKNYSFRIPYNPQKGELDIVAKPRRSVFDTLRGKKEDVIHFIEVKTLRASNSLISPEEKVNFSKQKKLILTAESWLMKRKIPLNSKWQIDIIAITIENKKAKISHFENAVSYSCS